jgi:hypothetical protein
MPADITLTGALVAAVAALATAVGVLWRESVKRSDDSHKVSLSMLEVLTLLKVNVSDLRADLDRLVSTRNEHFEQLDRLENDGRVHHERVLLLAESNAREHKRIDDLLDQIRKKVYGPIKAVRPSQREAS